MTRVAAQVGERKWDLPALPKVPATMIQPEIPVNELWQQFKEEKRYMKRAFDAMRDDLVRTKQTYEEELLRQRRQHLTDCKGYEKAYEEELERHKKQEEESRRSYEALKAEMSRLTLQVGALAAKKEPPHYQSPIKKKVVAAAAAEPPKVVAEPPKSAKATPRSVRTKTVYTKQTKKQF